MADNQSETLLSLLKDFSSKTDQEQREILAKLSPKEMTKIGHFFSQRT
jgi:hypothetical protein